MCSSFFESNSVLTLSLQKVPNKYYLFDINKKLKMVDLWGWYFEDSLVAIIDLYMGWSNPWVGYNGCILGYVFLAIEPSS